MDLCGYRFPMRRRKMLVFSKDRARESTTSDLLFKARPECVPFIQKGDNHCNCPSLTSHRTVGGAEAIISSGCCLN